MALLDLTPQLRTRLNRMERAVGWFVFLATALLVFGFAYYIYKTAESKGWFKNKAKYYIFTDTAKGINIGDPVEILGKNVGTITDVQPMPARGAGSEYNIYVEFDVLEPYYGYIWTEGSTASLISANPLLGNRLLEVSRGTNGYSTYIAYELRYMSWQEAQASPHFTNFHLGEDIRVGTNTIHRTWQLLTNITDLVNSNFWVIDRASEKKSLTAVWNPGKHRYEPITKTSKYGLPTHEEVALTDRLQALIGQVETALPNVLALTNQISVVLSNTAALTANANSVALNAQPTVSNLAFITANLRDPNGSLGNWLIPTNLQSQLATTLLNANTTITNVDTNLIAVAEQITKSLENLANITSNLNAQVQANSNMLTRVSDIIVHTDQFVQGLKHHWLLRSAFKTENTNSPSSSRSTQPALSPRAREQRP